LSNLLTLATSRTFHNLTAFPFPSAAQQRRNVDSIDVSSPFGDRFLITSHFANSSRCWDGALP
jgi:hypothetical protein